jgi:RHS repeat-associated protein
MGEENNQLYYYHGDHLGSAQIVTDPEGKIYEQLEYTPYGELWVEHLKTTIEATPFRFTGKERDSETGLYYFGARYLNPQTGMWLSADPAMGEYVPALGQMAKNLPSNGGVYNSINLHTYNYCYNNPVKYTDPDGRNPPSGADTPDRYKGFPRGEIPGSTNNTGRTMSSRSTPVQVPQADSPLVSISDRITMQEAYETDVGPCMFRALLALAETRTGQNLTKDQLQAARDDLMGTGVDGEWGVLNSVAVVNKGFELLGSNLTARQIERNITDGVLPEGTEATLIHRSPSATRNYQHWGEADARGNLVYDPLGYDSFQGEVVDEIRAFRFEEN